jgi:hypothetical protein
MPFTATHIAAIVPVAWLCRWRLPLSALAIGSMIPDVAAFFPQLFDYPTTHSFRGLITHSVPLGLIAFYLFHLVLKQPLVELLPVAGRERLRDWSRSEIDVRPSRIVIVSACIAFGALTHIVWDAFTHVTGWGVAMFPSLRQVVTNVDGRPLHLYSLLQHGSSLVLLPPLLIGFLIWLIRQPATEPAVNPRFSVPAWVTFTVGTMIAIGAWLYFSSLRTHQRDLTWIASLQVTVKHVGAVTLLMVVMYSLAMQLIWRIESESGGLTALSREEDSQGDELP